MSAHDGHLVWAMAGCALLVLWMCWCCLSELEREARRRGRHGGGPGPLGGD